MGAPNSQFPTVGGTIDPTKAKGEDYLNAAALTLPVGGYFAGAGRIAKAWEKAPELAKAFVSEAAPWLRDFGIGYTSGVPVAQQAYNAITQPPASKEERHQAEVDTWRRGSLQGFKEDPQGTMAELDDLMGKDLPGKLAAGIKQLTLEGTHPEVLAAYEKWKASQAGPAAQTQQALGGN